MLKPREDSGERRLEKAGEQSNFVKTCNLLSEFVQRRGSLRDLNLEISGKIESLEAIVNSMSLRSASAPPASDSPRNKEKSAEPEREQWTLDEPFRRLASTESSNDFNVELVSNCPSKETATAKRKTAQLTMFYGGRVLVFDDYPEERVNELVALAKKGSARMSYGIFSNNFPHEKWGTGAREGLPPRPQASVILSNSCKGKTETDTCKDVTSSSKGNVPGSPMNEATGSGNISCSF